MPHRLVLPFGNGRTRTYDFELESEGRGGWAWLVPLRMVDNPPFPGLPRVYVFDPNERWITHDMGEYRARGRTRNGRRYYSLVGQFDTPGYMPLEYVGE
jgi:hypothetical protein